MARYDRYSKIQRPNRPVGHRCMHCNRRATVTGWRRTGPTFAESLQHRIYYCDQHADVLIPGKVRGS